jgi:dipeptidyl aminopeptidase/acylaminoacyl peptidase
MNKLLLSLLILSCSYTHAQDDIRYQTPPEPIAQLLLSKPTPGVIFDNKGEWMLLLERNLYTTVEELAQPELRIAGLRINPNNFGPSRAGYYTDIQLKNLKSGQTYPISGLPENLRAGSIQWNPSEKSFAFTHSTNTQINLYRVSIEERAAKKINMRPLNAVLAGSYWWQNDTTIVYKAVAAEKNAMPAKPIAPDGPVVQESKGKSAASRTYQDLIKNKYDELLFEYYATSQLVKINTNTEVELGKPALYSGISKSPDGNYLLLRLIEKPFSYLVPAFGFPHKYVVADKSGAIVKTIANNPSSEGAPIGFDDVVAFPRSVAWRDDLPATVTYVQALDNGLGKSKVAFRDAFFSISATGNEHPKELFKTKRRFANIIWGNASTAIFYESMNADNRIRTNKLNPLTGEVDSLHERNRKDEYSSLGAPITQKNGFGKQILLLLKNGNLLLESDGAGPEGDLPLLSSWNLTSGKRKELWRCRKGVYETIVNIIDAEKGLFITRRESNNEPPNYYFRNFLNQKQVEGTAITSFKNPYIALDGISKQKISYKRADGIDLTGTLYLPKGYDSKKDGPLPIVMWAYPIEYKSKLEAAQVRGSKYTFTTPGWGSPVYWVTQGYVVLDNAEMPIVGDGSNEPNDNFIPQLYLNAHAAIQALVKMGVGDSNRVAVGGHSYGAFMTANLLAHTNLFKAGIARSGAYNRTLTPFGFQSEERTYWQAPDIYFKMSPFSYADKIKTPLLLIHGDADNNTGTFPIQSERLFNAVKGHGGTVRYVSLPYESHGYNAKENLLHLLWEQHQWLEKYVKNVGTSK